MSRPDSEPQISWIERAKNEFLRPPTKVEMLALTPILVADIAAITGLIVNEKVFGNNSYPWLDILIGLNLVGGICFLIEGINEFVDRIHQGSRRSY